MSLPDFFPYNVMQVLGDGLGNGMVDHSVVLRRLGTTEPELAIGVFPESLSLTAVSQEIGTNEPTVTQYNLSVQNLVKSADREYAVNVSAVNSKIVRVLLYRSPVIQLGLAGLVEENLGSRERFQRLRVSRQRFMDGRIGQAFMFLTTTDVIVETETVRI
jgi:hypothetical protein